MITRDRRFHPEPGSVSSGTLRGEDLAETFVGLLREYYDSTDEDRKPSKQLLELLAEADRVALEIEGEDEDAGEIIEELFDELNNLSPPYCYFGANEGDGSCFGWWPSEDAISDALCDGFLVESDKLPEYAIRRDDHGGMMLLRVETGEPVWGV